MAKSLHLFAVALIACGMAGTAPAQSLLPGWKGEISSSDLRRLPPNPVFDVTIYDDTEQNLAFRRQFLEALAKAGYKTADNAPLEFSFATSITWREARLRELENQRRRNKFVDVDEASFPDSSDPVLGNESGRDIFGDYRSRPPRIPSSISNAQQDRLDITVELRDRDSGHILWTADLALPLLEMDRARITRSIIGPIIRAIGRNVQHKPFPVK